MISLHKHHYDLFEEHKKEQDEFFKDCSCDRRAVMINAGTSHVSFGNDWGNDNAYCAMHGWLQSPKEDCELCFGVGEVSYYDDDEIQRWEDCQCVKKDGREAEGG